MSLLYRTMFVFISLKNHKPTSQKYLMDGCLWNVPRLVFHKSLSNSIVHNLIVLRFVETHWDQIQPVMV